MTPTPQTRRRVLAAAAALAAYSAGCAPQAPEPFVGAADTEKMQYAQPVSQEQPSDYDVRVPRPPRANRGQPRQRGGTRPGGTLPPDHVRYCESRGDYTAQNRHSSASGGWQITDGSWGGYQGYEHAKDAPREVQDARAAELWNGGRGASNWEACL